MTGRLTLKDATGVMETENVSHHMPTLQPAWWPPTTHICTDGTFTPSIPKLLINPALLNRLYSLLPWNYDLFSFLKSTTVQYINGPHGGTKHIWMRRELSKVLMSSGKKGAQLSSSDVTLCPSTNSCLHIVDSTNLTGWLLPENPEQPPLFQA